MGLADPFPIADHPNPRVAGWRGVTVNDVHDEEEAYERGTPLEVMSPLYGHAPNRQEGGYRRVSIRLLTWVIDERRRSAYDPQWITAGWGMTAKSASDSYDRYVESYANAVDKGIESRRLKVTAIEVVFWTASVHTDYV